MLETKKNALENEIVRLEKRVKLKYSEFNNLKKNNREVTPLKKSHISSIYTKVKRANCPVQAKPENREYLSPFNQFIS